MIEIFMRHPFTRPPPAQAVCRSQAEKPRAGDFAAGWHDFHMSAYPKPRPWSLLLLVLCLIACGTAGADTAGQYLKRPDEWFATSESRRVADCILSHQGAQGAWAKNTATTREPFTGKPEDISPSFDNGATTDELRFLARSFAATADPRDAAAVLKGVRYILAAQYPNGGWPQFHPPGSKYHRHITFNDGAMVRLMEFLREAQQAAHFRFLPEDLRQDAAHSFELGIACILKCQIQVNGQPTVWCAQHDEDDFSPRLGRSYELPSFSGSESVGIVRLLMSLERPTPEVVAAIEGAVAWLDAARITGVRIESRNGDRTLLEDPDAPDLWARFYDLESAAPLFADRDGIPKASLAEIGKERRNGYSWYGNWPEKLLQRDYPEWQKRIRKIPVEQPETKHPGGGQPAGVLR